MLDRRSREIREDPYRWRCRGDRDDFAQIMKELDFVKAQLARFPMRRDQGRASDGDPLEWHVGSSARGPTRHHVQDCLVAGAEAFTDPS
jgi:hypothetical protein